MNILLELQKNKFIIRSITTKICSSCRTSLDADYTFETCIDCRERSKIYNRNRCLLRRSAATVSVRSTEVDEATLETGSNIRAERATRPAEVVPAAYISELDKMEPLDLGRMDIQCPDCKVYHWKGEKTNGGSSWESCCKKGSVKLPLLNELPQLLNDLLTGAHPKSTVFLKNVRQYTSAFAFTSFGTAVKSSINNTGSRSMLFQAHGKLYHLQGPISSSGNSRPQYSQLYIYDPASFAADIRFTDQRNHLLDRDLKNDLSIMLHYQCNNPFVEIYKHAHKILSTEADCQLRENNNELFYVGLNPQMKMELIVDTDSSEDHTRLFKRINETHAAYMPLHYVLLFPAGDYGWNWDTERINKAFYTNNPASSGLHFTLIFKWPHSLQGSFFTFVL
ncbi:hypothetical protein BD770DRAFT_449674 [Pilaira anomala]|nr:hypothetical protein BD770DRAFT_449674 [Pilaira anomala]